MNPAYFKTRLRAQLPGGNLPQNFSVITVCNPAGEVISHEENKARTATFRKQLNERELVHFPVTGYDPDSAHEEQGFGIVCDAETARALGQEWNQEAIFRVDNGRVKLVSCEPSAEEFPLKLWSEMADL
jgi:hypothetical protein